MNKKEIIEVPREWFVEVIRLAKKVDTSKPYYKRDNLNLLLGYLSSAEFIIKGK